MEVLLSGVARRGLTIGVLTLAGGRRWLRMDTVPIRGGAGSVTRAVCSFIEIPDYNRERPRRDSPAEELLALRQEQALQAEVLAQVSITLASAVAPDQLYVLILDQVSRVLPYDHAAVLLHQKGWVTVAGSRGRITMPVGARAFQVKDIAHVAAFGHAGKPGLIRDTRDLPAWIEVPPFTGDHVIRSVIVVPLVVDGTVVGTFNLDSFTPYFYTERHLAIALAFAERVTQALYNARLHAVQLERARAFEQLAGIQADFVAAVSHELRTPLTAIIGFAEILEARWGDLNDTRRLDQIHKIVLAANRQRRLVEDLLLLRQVEGQTFTLQSQPLLVAPLLDEAAAEVTASYSGQLISRRGPGETRILADPMRMLQILTNLLDNAAKYSPDGSPIDVEWARQGGWVAISVRDHGPGIPEDGRRRLFTRFGRVPGSRIRAGRAGTGLGLYLSRLLAEAMRGTLELESSGLQGSVFRLLLPAAPDSRGDA